MDALTILCISFGLSCTTLVLGLVLAMSTSERLFSGKFGPKTGKRVNRITLLVWVFISLVLYNLGVDLFRNPYAIQRFINAVSQNLSQAIICYFVKSLSALSGILYHSLQMMLAGIDIPCLGPNTPPIIDLYSHAVFVVAPVATLYSVIDQLTEFFAVFQMRRRARRLKSFNTYLITPLNDRTLALAHSIKTHCENNTQGGRAAPGTIRRSSKRKPIVNIVFTNVQEGEDSSLVDKARGARATLLRQSLESTLQGLGSKCEVSVVLDSDNEAWNVTKARAIVGLENIRLAKLVVYFISNPYGSGAGQLSTKKNPATLYRVDWTRNLVEDTLKKYPTFLKSLPPSSASGQGKEAYLSWQDRMIKQSERHVLVVGAGHVGTEFLRLAMSYSRIYGMHFTFDVFDRPYGYPISFENTARQRIMALAPELLIDDALIREQDISMKVCFHNTDVHGNEYTKFLKDHGETITYVFVALGDDELTADIAQRTRTTLNRERVSICARKKTQLKDYDNPIIVAVIDNDELSKVIADRWKNSPNQIITVGSSSEMYAYDMVFSEQDADSDYDTLSKRASKAHAKYRLFAYEHRIRSRDDAGNEPKLAIMWCEGLDSGCCNDEDTRKAVKRYNAYLDQMEYNAEQQDGEDVMPDYEWLLRMEHARWSTYTRAEGYCHVPLDYIKVYYKDAGNGYQGNTNGGHRYDDALIHACLVPFDALDDVRKEINEIATGRTQDYFWKNDKRQLHIEPSQEWTRGE